MRGDAPRRALLPHDSIPNSPSPSLLPLSFSQVRSPPAEGVYIHGLFLDGAAWSKSEGVLMESEPKKLFVPLPVLFASANTKTEQAKVRDRVGKGGMEMVGSPRR